MRYQVSCDIPVLRMRMLITISIRDVQDPDNEPGPTTLQSLLS
jgi:hypothetical protein